MRLPFPNNLYLTGFMGAGKSAIGRRLAKRWSAPFVDTDDKIREKAGLSIPEIFASQGEDAFRALETEVLNDLAQAPGLIVALGGGALVRAENQKIVFESGTVIYLRAEVATICRRIGNSNRPLVRDYQGEALVERVTTLLKSREPIYLRAAMVVDTDGKTPEAVAEIISEKVGV